MGKKIKKTQMKRNQHTNTLIIDRNVNRERGTTQNEESGCMCICVNPFIILWKNVRRKYAHRQRASMVLLLR